MQEDKTFAIEINSEQPDRDASELAERFTSIDIDVRRHLSDESIDILRSLRTSRIELKVTTPAMISIAHALISWLKAKPSSTQVTVRTDLGIYQLRPGEAGDIDQFINFLRSSIVSGAVSNPPNPWRL
jgi:hypothetical protein